MDNILENLIIPNHIAIIMDGNGRWAKERNMPRTFGHKNGSDNLIKLVEYCSKIGLKNLTVYAFSTENWSRPKEEVNFLMNLLETSFKSLLRKINKNNVRIKVIGEKDNLSDKLLGIIKEVEEKTKDKNGLLLNIAFNYGSRYELVHAFKEVIQNDEEINQENINKHLYTSDSGDVDLLIRTSGELRISNFLLWQISYAEIYVTNTYWPDFDESCLNDAIIEYNKKNRRFGGLK